MTRQRLVQCSCGTYLDHPGEQPVLPEVNDPIVLTVGILNCPVCRGTEWDAVKHSRPNEMLIDVRMRIGRAPQSVIERWVMQKARTR